MVISQKYRNYEKHKGIYITTGDYNFLTHSDLLLLFLF